ncbi:MAG: glutathione-disulfide reductase [Pseudomonadota bacterium]
MSEHAFDFDLFVIGGGSGGVRAARIAAGHGARVALAESYRMGGTCVIRGCVPKKLMVYASEYADKINQARAFGWPIEAGPFAFPAFMEKLRAEVTRLSGLYMIGQQNAGVTVFEDRAEFIDAHTLKLVASGTAVTANKILVAVGGTPWMPAPSDAPSDDPNRVMGIEHAITSDQVFDLTELPKRILIAGGGYIAVEFAHIFNGLGCETKLNYRRDRVLRGFDQDVREIVHQGLLDSGVEIITNTVIHTIEKTAGAAHRFKVTFTDGATDATDLVFMAVGREPAIEGLGLQNAGVEIGPAGEIKVDSFSKTNVPSIWAVGDVTRRMELTPVAIREGHAFADTEFGNTSRVMDHANIATAVFTQPEVGTVGLSEEDARQIYPSVDIYKTHFRPMRNAITGDHRRVFMKLVVNRSDQRVVGVHIVGPEASEMIQMLAIAVQVGVTKPQFDATCAVHPTLGEEIVTLRTRS